MTNNAKCRVVDYPERPLTDKTNNLESIITLVQSALAQFLITRGGSGFSQVNACCTWRQVSYDTINILSVSRSQRWEETVSVENTTSHFTYEQMIWTHSRLFVVRYCRASRHHITLLETIVCALYAKSDRVFESVLRINIFELCNQFIGIWAFVDRPELLTDSLYRVHVYYVLGNLLEKLCYDEMIISVALHSFFILKHCNDHEDHSKKVCHEFEKKIKTLSCLKNKNWFCVHLSFGYMI